MSGFLSALLKKNIIITGILESETNQLSATDKYTRVDILAEDVAGTKFIIEVQNSYNQPYLQRMLYGASKMLVESVVSGEDYSKLRKVISINILYYQFQGGKDSIYRGKTHLIGDTTGEELELTEEEKEAYKAERPSDLFIEFVIIALSNFDGHLRSQIDAWMYLFINDSLPQKPEIELSAEVIQAKEVVHDLFLNAEERKAHDDYLMEVWDARNITQTAHDTGKIEGRIEGLVEGEKIGIEKGLQIGKAEGLQEGELKGKLLAAKAMLDMDIDKAKIMAKLDLSEEDLADLS